MKNVVAFTMKLLPGKEDVYEDRHNKIWPELSSLLKESGIEEYHIFLDKDTGVLFAFQRLGENNQVKQLPEHPIMKKWWAHMQDLMETHVDHSPVVKQLENVFTL